MKQQFEQLTGLSLISVERFAGEADDNYRLTDTNGTPYLLKVSTTVDPDRADFERQLIDCLRRTGFSWQLPDSVQLTETSFHKFENERLIRLQTWVPGKPLRSLPEWNDDTLRRWGKLTGELSRSLADFRHPAAVLDYRWNPATLLAQSASVPLLRDEDRANVQYFFERFETQVAPRLSQLRRSVIYADAHEDNVLVNEKGQLSGLIDFGDALYSQTINELAIALAYALAPLPDPLGGARVFIGASQAVFSWQAKELDLLYDLIAARACITLLAAAEGRAEQPDHAYLQVSDQSASGFLQRWRSIPPQLARANFRRAAGYAPLPVVSIYQKWLTTKPDFAPIVEQPDDKMVALDLSIGSTLLGNNANFETIEAFNRTLEQILREQDATLALNGYAEARPFYSTDAYQQRGNSGPRWRTVHLGLDYWTKAGRAVRAPLDGTVYGFYDNAAERDYGPTIILKHQPAPDLTFYTLYGHLDRASLAGLCPGQFVAAGTPFARIGPPPENGNWPPHLHFQILLDPLGNHHDFPGVCFPEERDVWLTLCPSPHDWFPHLPKTPNPILPDAEHLARRAACLGPNLSISYRSGPVFVVRGYRQFLYDHHGRRFLDTVNNVAHVGHEHPHVVTAAQRQMGTLNTNTRYPHPLLVRYAERLARLFPDPLSVVYLVNSGSEANELALRMVRTLTQNRGVVAMQHGYHGNTGNTVDVSSYKFEGKGGFERPVNTFLLPAPDTFRGVHAEHPLGYLAEAEQLLTGRSFAGFIHESILSCGGQMLLPSDYLKTVYTHIRRTGGLCIADEVQTGFGRVGTHQWAFEQHGVVPDIVTLGKPIGNGHPLGAVVCTRSVAEGFANGMEYFNTYGGNPVSCAVGMAVLDVLEAEQLQRNALETGTYLRELLLELQAKFPRIGDVRGTGFFQGIELVQAPGTKLPDAKLAHKIVQRLRRRAILTSTDGPDHNVLKFKPPMCFDRVDAARFVEELAGCSTKC